MNRVTRIWGGLVLLIPVLAIVGWFFEEFEVLQGEERMWLIFGFGLVWVAVVVWWGLKGPEATHFTEETRSQYLAFLRGTEYEPPEGADEPRIREHID